MEYKALHGLETRNQLILKPLVDGERRGGRGRRGHIVDDGQQAGVEGALEVGDEVREGYWERRESRHSIGGSGRWGENGMRRSGQMRRCALPVLPGNPSQ